jgi:hypothetical protein
MEYDNKKFNIIVIIAKIRIFTNLESSMPIREVVGSGAGWGGVGRGGGRGVGWVWA